MAKIVLLLLPVILDIIAIIALGALRKHDMHKENVVTMHRAALSPETINIMLDSGMGDCVGPLAHWLLPDDENLSFLRSSALGDASAVSVVWIYEQHMLIVDKEMAVHTSMLLDQLDFSHSSIAQFFTVIRAVHNVSESTKGWQRVANVAWIILWAIMLKIPVSFAIVIVYELWCWIAALLEARIRNR